MGNSAKRRNRKNRRKTAVSHPHFPRHIAGLACGGFIMLTGSEISHHIETVSTMIPLSHAALDAIAWGIHAIGATPVVYHSARLWRIFGYYD
jgi:hypothetical protein